MIDEIKKQFIIELEKDIENKNFLTYDEKNEWLDYLDRIINSQIKEKDKEIARLNNIINELEKWLEEKQALYEINQQGFSWGVAGDCLDKLKELKEGK